LVPLSYSSHGVFLYLGPDNRGIRVYGFHNQYYLSFDRVPVPVTLSGTVKLPLTPMETRAP